MESQLSIFVKILASMALGALIGYDREREHKAAGLRTHICVAGAAAFFVGIAIPLIRHFQSDVFDSIIRSDPIRIIEAIITGVAFLGAGTIIKGKDSSVHGLTTAASLLLTAAVGVAVGIEMYLVAVLVAVTVFIVLTSVAKLSKKIQHR